MNSRSVPIVEELGYDRTSMGELVLRRRRSPSVDDEFVYEITVDGEMLMSSTVNTSERALATLALDGLEGRREQVLVGGLGLGYTAAAVLEYPDVERVVVIEILQPVIDWHQRGLVPAARVLTEDPRCTLVRGDFFDLALQGDGQAYNAVLLDIDHAPDALLHPRHEGLYRREGLRKLSRLVAEGGVFGLWSAWKPPAGFLGSLEEVFSAVCCNEVVFYNPHTGLEDSNWITTASRPG